MYKTNNFYLFIFLHGIKFEQFLYFLENSAAQKRFTVHKWTHGCNIAWNNFKMFKILKNVIIVVIITL